MTKQEAIDELHRHYVPEYVNYIVTALTDGATPSDAPTINAIPIPEDATNGDVIKAMFPNLIWHSIKGLIGKTSADMPIGDRWQKNVFYCDTDWWETPYKSERKDKECTKIQ